MEATKTEQEVTRHLETEILTQKDFVDSLLKACRLQLPNSLIPSVVGSTSRWH